MGIVIIGGASRLGRATLETRIAIIDPAKEARPAPSWRVAEVA